MAGPRIRPRNMNLQLREQVWNFIIERNMFQKGVANWEIIRIEFNLRNTERKNVFEMFHRLCDRLQRNEDVYPLPSRAGDGPGHGMLLIGPQLPVKQEEEMDQQPDDPGEVPAEYPANVLAHLNPNNLDDDIAIEAEFQRSLRLVRAVKKRKIIEAINFYLQNVNTNYRDIQNQFGIAPSSFRTHIEQFDSTGDVKVNLKILEND